MLQLEHINLVVKDIPAMLRFYQAAFPYWFVRDQGDGEWNGKPREWLHFGDNYQYIAMSDHGEGNNRDLAGHQVGLAHFAYVTSNLSAIICRLQEAGFKIAKDGAEDLHRKNIYFIDPAGFEVEFVQYLSDIPEERNSTQ
ncbi:MAG: catechol 2,3-dioxygenase-like lactoylglutathione lyase family enzyme [Colwellia sp.]|jgi:catechol 2,3-dioxygenase-like lactoylglutathione lyase family enzyme|tara:strand:+ start:955 stop:1374 length:420 start_codon:yes stop_codon:yes gene_type:complete